MLGLQLAAEDEPEAVGLFDEETGGGVAGLGGMGVG
jgi:hypothetical protein